MLNIPKGSSSGKVLRLKGKGFTAKGGTRGSANQAVFGQLGAYPRALYVAAGLLLLLAMMPGLPMFPFVTLAAGMAEARAAGKLFYLVANIYPHNAKLRTFADDMAPAMAQNILPPPSMWRI